MFATKRSQTSMNSDGSSAASSPSATLMDNTASSCNGLIPVSQESRATDKQVGGDHYKKLTIQPAEYISANKLSYLKGRAIAYITRADDKGGVQDLKKAIHSIELEIQLNYQKK
jgi:hypothetical protein